MVSLQSRFLAETETYYAAEADRFLQQNPVTDYMKKVERRLDEEKQRCEMYLNISTLQALQDKLDKVLIAAKLEIFQVQTTRGTNSISARIQHAA